MRYTLGWYVDNMHRYTRENKILYMLDMFYYITPLHNGSNEYNI